MCLDSVRVDYQPEGGSLVMYTVDSATATSATLSNLQCNTQYNISVHASGGTTGTRSLTIKVSLSARGIVAADGHLLLPHSIHITLYVSLHAAPPTPTKVTAETTYDSSVRVTWQWASSGPAPSCFNTTCVTYRHPEEGGESSLQLRDPAANETILTGLQSNTCYTITVVATAGEYRRESVTTAVLLPQVLQGMTSTLLVMLMHYTYNFGLYYFGEQKVHAIVSWIREWIEVKTDLIFLLGMSANKN